MKRFECLYPISLRDFLSEQMGISKKKAKELIDLKCVFVNKQLVWIATHELRRGDKVEVIEKKKIDFDPSFLLLDNESVLGVYKPAGMVVQDNKDSLETQLRYYFGDKRICAIHRLDKDTSGVVLFAKTEEVHTFYKKKWDEVVEKYYLAICQGTIPFVVKRLRDYLENKVAEMDVVRLAVGDDYSLVGVRLHTGRKHQIRIQMSRIGFPLVGDRLYGPKKLKKRELRQVFQQYLHAYEVRGILPSGERFRVVAPLPQDMKMFMKRHHLDNEVVWETEKWFGEEVEEGEKKKL